MYCSNCGKEIKETDKFCTECGLKVERKENNKVETTVVVGENAVKPNQENLEKAKSLCIISLICMYGLGFVGVLVRDSAPLLVNILALGPLAAWVLVIVARVKYKESKFAKILLIVYIVQTVLIIIFYAIMLITCFHLLSNCDMPGVIYNLLW